jgi:hypothetical protein
VQDKGLLLYNHLQQKVFSTNYEQNSPHHHYWGGVDVPHLAKVKSK